jgi:hypothetical protein
MPCEIVMCESIVMLDMEKAIALHKCPMVSLLVLVSWTVTFLPTLRAPLEGKGFLRDCRVEKGNAF